MNRKWPSITSKLELEICLAMSKKAVVNIRSYGDHYNLFSVICSLNMHFKQKCLRIKIKDNKIFVLMNKRSLKEHDINAIYHSKYTIEPCETSMSFINLLCNYAFFFFF